jgi:hypothetical protein
MPDIFVAFSGTPEASTADFVCDGSSDDVEFQAAIAAAQAGGGGIVHIGEGTYSISRPVVVEDSGVHLQGAGAGQTTFEVAGDWQSLLHPNGAHLAGAITFVACDNFSVTGITVDADTNSVHCNGIVAIPDGASGTGTPCTNGVISGNEVFLTQMHDYSIWSLRGQHIQISDNLSSMAAAARQLTARSKRESRSTVAPMSPSPATPCATSAVLRSTLVVWRPTPPTPRSRAFL